MFLPLSRHMRSFDSVGADAGVVLSLAFKALDSGFVLGSEMIFVQSIETNISGIQKFIPFISAFF